MEVLTLIFYAIILFIAFILLRRHFESQEIEGINRKAVFITGCDSGFGYGLALKCLERGMPVFAGCLTNEGVVRLIKESKTRRGNLDAFTCDVRSDDSMTAVKRRLEKATANYGGLHGVVNNAGIVGHAFYDDFLSVDDYQNVFDVNTLGVIRSTKFLKSLVIKAKGRIVTVASICARVGLPGIGPYTVSKYAVSGYCDVIRQELRQFGVSVHILEPGFFKTPLIAANRIEAQIDDAVKKASAEAKEIYGEQFVKDARKKTLDLLEGIGSKDIHLVVDAYFHALTAKYPRYRYQIGWDSILLFIPLSYLPTYLGDCLMRLSDVLVGLPKPAYLSKK